MAFTQQFSNRVLTTTTVYFMPSLVDTVLRQNQLLADILKNTEKWDGETLKQPIKISKNQTFGSFAGYDLLSTNAQNTRVNAQFQPKFVKIDVSLPMDEISTNQTDAKILNLIDLELKSSAQDMADGLGTLIYASDAGLGSSPTYTSKDPFGLKAIIDDGSVIDDFGGLSRATYTTLAAKVTASGGTISLTKIATMVDSLTSGSITTSDIYTTPAIFSLYEALRSPIERYAVTSTDMTSGIRAIAGATEAVFRTIPIRKDEKATAQTMFFINRNFLKWHSLPFYGAKPIEVSSKEIEGNLYNKDNSFGFSWSGWINMINQAAIVGHIYLGGNLICTNPIRQGKITGITTI